MEAAVGAANWLLGKVVAKLTDDLVAAYVASLELGDNFRDIQLKLLYTQGLLHVAQGRDLNHNPALQLLLQKLSAKADEAEDALDELHYFIIQDTLDGTKEAAVEEPGPEIGPQLQAHVVHGRHALRSTVGNCLRCFSCFPTQGDDSTVIISAPAASNPPHNTTTKSSGNDNISGHDDKLRFERVAMSNKIKSVIKDIHSICDPISDLLGKVPYNHTTGPLIRPQRGSAIVEDELIGRDAILKKTSDGIIGCGETLSVLPVFGPGGIGKTRFTQHLYKMTADHFRVKVWVCVSTDFDVLKLTQQILGCITEKEGRTSAYAETNLDQLQNSIAEKLKSEKFLIVLDDIWKCGSEGDWKAFLAPFTKGEVKGSMVLVTTRFPYIADMVKTTDPIKLEGLNSTDFLKLFEACIFGENGHYKDKLTDIAREIADKLNGFPLAAKTVGRMLKKNLTREHWMGVLRKHEWRNQKNNGDIMPSLKISYDYLPFDLKKCFSYFALFPKDHRFNSLEINHFWIAIGIIDSSQGGDRNYLEELVDNGFLMKVDDYSGQYYVMHDLMHELSQIVSAQECINISSLDFRSDTLPQTIRHLSITMEDRYDENFDEEMCKLKGRIDMENLRTLMIFRRYEEKITEILKDTFRKINGLRVLFIVLESLESLPYSFSKLKHLQYLKISSPGYDYLRDMVEMNYDREMTLPIPSSLCRFYHLKFLDLSDWNGSSSLPKDISRLVNLRYFLAVKELHSNIPEVGKMKYLQELKEFCVKKERDGFELRELGELTELGGELSVCNLENVTTKGEASQAKLISKRNLKGLRLVWGREQQPTMDVDVLNVLKPHYNLKSLEIINHYGTVGPKWLCLDIRVKSLERLHLVGVSWGTLPPFGELPYLEELRLERVSGVCQLGPDYGGVTGKGFEYLKKVVFADLPKLTEWVVEPICHSFPSLESIICEDCPKLCMMPFSEFCCTNLCSLIIDRCPKLSLPPMPHTTMLTFFEVQNNDRETLTYDGNLTVQKRSKWLTYNGKKLHVNGYNGALAFHNMDKVDDMRIEYVSHFSLTGLENLKSLRELSLRKCGSISYEGNVVSHSVQRLSLDGSHLRRNMLSNLFSFFAALSVLKIIVHEEGPEERVLQFPSSSSLQTLMFKRCRHLVLLPAEDGGGIQDMASLQSLTIQDCGMLFSRWPMGDHSISPFPASLRELDVQGESSLQSMALLSNLTSLACLRLKDCYNLTIDGFNPLITVNLKELVVSNSKLGKNDPDSVAADLLSEVARNKSMPVGSFKLEKLVVDSISSVLVSPVYNLLASTLHTLEFRSDHRTDRLTEEQEEALQLLSSLQKLEFYACMGLGSLPQGLHLLSSLKELEISYCYNLQSLPKEGFPTSLQKLVVGSSRPDFKEQVEMLKGSNPDLHIDNW